MNESINQSILERCADVAQREMQKSMQWNWESNADALAWGSDRKVCRADPAQKDEESRALLHRRVGANLMGGQWNNERATETHWLAWGSRIESAGNLLFVAIRVSLGPRKKWEKYIISIQICDEEKNDVEEGYGLPKTSVSSTFKAVSVCKLRKSKNSIY